MVGLEGEKVLNKGFFKPHSPTHVNQTSIQSTFFASTLPSKRVSLEANVNELTLLKSLSKSEHISVGLQIITSFFFMHN